MAQVFDLPTSSAKWWELVWFLPATVVSPPDSSWQELDGHPCGGMSCNYMDGWVKPLPASAMQDIQQAVVDESWCSERLGLDYEVSGNAKSEYIAYLSAQGLEAGDLSSLRQAVYPLARTQEVCERLKIVPEVEPTAALVLLGQNCD